MGSAYALNNSHKYKRFSIKFSVDGIFLFYGQFITSHQNDRRKTYHIIIIIIIFIIAFPQTCLYLCFGCTWTTATPVHSSIYTPRGLRAWREHPEQSPHWNRRPWTWRFRGGKPRSVRWFCPSPAETGRRLFLAWCLFHALSEFVSNASRSRCSPTSL